MTNAVSNLIASRINHQQEKKEKIHKDLPGIRFQTNQLLLKSLMKIPTPSNQDQEKTNLKKTTRPELMNHLQFLITNNYGKIFQKSTGKN